MESLCFPGRRGQGRRDTFLLSLRNCEGQEIFTKSLSSFIRVFTGDGWVFDREGGFYTGWRVAWMGRRC